MTTALRLVAVLTALAAGACATNRPPPPKTPAQTEAEREAEYQRAVAAAKQNPIATPEPRSLLPEKAPPKETRSLPEKAPPPLERGQPDQAPPPEEQQPSASAGGEEPPAEVLSQEVIAPAEPPPPPTLSPRPFAPAPGYLWVDGYWYWYGGRYVWISGTWVAPRPGYHYVGARWVFGPRGWVFVAGGWAPLGSYGVLYPLYLHRYLYRPHHHHPRPSLRHPSRRDGVHRERRRPPSRSYRGSSRHRQSAPPRNLKPRNRTKARRR